ncbi:MAG: MarR family winged helix-turn-helix transcriptional regulator [Desulfovibrionaceae bacterium]
MRHAAAPDNSARLVGFATRAYRSELARRFAAAGLPVTAEQWPLLLLVQAEPGLTQAELAARLMREKTVVSRLAAALEDRGLLTRRADPADARLRRLRTTPTGEALMPALWREAQAVLDLAETGIAPTDLDAMRRVLKRIAANLASEGMR